MESVHLDADTLGESLVMVESIDTYHVEKGK